MNHLRRFGRFWYDFLVGDDWTIAACVVAVVFATDLLARRWDAWPLLPLAVAAALTVSVQRATRQKRRSARRS